MKVRRRTSEGASVFFTANLTSGALVDGKRPMNTASIA
jgi:hypothetical protein